MKKILYIIILIGLIQVVSASMCGDQIDITTNCTMLTPVITCSAYNYTITNITGSQVENGNLTAFPNSSVYYFNFTELKGNYIIQLCDGSTREIKVENSDVDSMGNALSLVLGIGAIITILIVLSIKLNEEHKILKMLSLFIAVFLALLIPKAIMEFTDIATSSIFYIGYIWFIRIFMTYMFLFYFVYQPMIKWGWIKK